MRGDTWTTSEGSAYDEIDNRKRCKTSSHSKHVKILQDGNISRTSHFLGVSFPE